MKKISDKIDIIKKRSKEIDSRIREQTVTYITAAFGFVAGLAWNDAIKSLIEYLFPISKNTVFARFAYAILVTLLIVLISRWLFSIISPKAPDVPPKKRRVSTVK
ncbi:MAG: DUF5654 family protein [Candidatus Colwellbacteria bacterium]|nr:DUF5654 family protein [Candidatus Colwellbacteria bacterium]